MDRDSDRNATDVRMVVHISRLVVGCGEELLQGRKLQRNSVAVLRFVLQLNTHILHRNKAKL